MISPELVVTVCAALQIPLSAFPHSVVPLPLRLAPNALTTLQVMSQHARLVTFSNVICLEGDNDRLRELLHPWVVDHFPSFRAGYAKPDPDAFRHVAHTCGASTARMVHIGADWTCDIIGAIMDFSRAYPDEGFLRWLYPVYSRLLKWSGVDSGKDLDSERLMAKWEKGRELLRARLTDVLEEAYLSGGGIIISGRRSERIS